MYSTELRARAKQEDTELGPEPADPREHAMRVKRTDNQVILPTMRWHSHASTSNFGVR